MSSPESPEERAGLYSTDDDDQLPQEDTLIDRGVDDILDEGYSPPDKWREPRDHETLDELLAEEEPDPAMQLDDGDSGSDVSADFSEDDEAGDRRAGRLVAPDDGVNLDDESELLATDVGIDGSAASAEEAAVHVIDDEE
ncbi:hypothetical protein CIW52_19185 [Mycolicibacterium sp. P9-64]|uniref:DUF5709 domain-containing protein n=1 Tax=Mycolicibacterium sp. P9-64 TaxID=2024612 RepID=UPI0011F05124|nr:DUF5709 domain-containing protein [Mycolicibacterium sp. P9-64]KAA0081840.1 hypothetical protein CIW52_19185 [Mycolicibacterium sp. P9-64]